jgi:hypothetical protein
MITLIILLVVVGFGLYLLETYVPMSPPFILIIRFVVILFGILVLLQVFGIYDSGLRIR